MRVASKIGTANTASVPVLELSQVNAGIATSINPRHGSNMTGLRPNRSDNMPLTSAATIIVAPTAILIEIERVIGKCRMVSA
ncbi:hypothetical protein D3C76_1734290 [compost metagenome]